MVILFEVLCVVALIGFCIVVWWPAAFLIFGLACGFIAWNMNRGEQK